MFSYIEDLTIMNMNIGGLDIQERIVVKVYDMEMILISTKDVIYIHGDVLLYGNDRLEIKTGLSLGSTTPYIIAYGILIKTSTYPKFNKSWDKE